MLLATLAYGSGKPYNVILLPCSISSCQEWPTDIAMFHMLPPILFLGMRKCLILRLQLVHLSHLAATATM